MNYDVVKIATENGMEVAYLLNHKTGRIEKHLVEDKTGMPHLASPESFIERDDFTFPVRPVLMPGREGPNTVKIPATLVPGGFKVSAEDLARTMEAKQKAELPDKPAPLKPPPHLANVFGGTAEEKRTA